MDSLPDDSDQELIPELTEDMSKTDAPPKKRKKRAPPATPEQKPLDTPLAHDHTKVIADQDEKKYREQRDLIKRRIPDVSDADFDVKGGKFYGMSTNELADWYKERSQS